MVFGMSRTKMPTHELHDVCGRQQIRRRAGVVAPSTAHDVIQSQQLEAGSEFIVKLAGKNKVEVMILGKAPESEHAPRFSVRMHENTKGQQRPFLA